MKKILFTLIVTCLVVSSATAQIRFDNRETDSLIVAALAGINADSLQAGMQALQDMGTRFMIAPNRREVATWLMERFLAYGITEVQLDSFQCYSNINFPFIVYDTTTWQYNVEARITGSSFPGEEIVLVGHYDDVVQYSDPMILAPGADDNASGTSALLECARVISEIGYQPAQTFIFLASAAEELLYYGDAGTEHYAAEASEEGRNIVMAINNDMISWNDGSWTLDLFNHILSPHITSLAIEVIEKYTTLNYNSWTPVYDVGADIQPFLDAGYHGIYFMEHYINPNYHKVTDLVENCDLQYLAEATRVSLGCMLTYDLTVGLEEPEHSCVDISVYPNPASSETSIHIEDQGFSTWNLMITDITGHALYDLQWLPGSQILDITLLPDGFYLMIFSNGKDMRMKKLIVRHE